MDPIGLIIVITFLSMLASCGLAVSRQYPPVTQAHVRCPEDGGAATVSLAWRATNRDIEIVTCDRRMARSASCREGCKHEAREAYSEPLATTIIV